METTCRCSALRSLPARLCLMQPVGPGCWSSIPAKVIAPISPIFIRPSGRAAARPSSAPMGRWVEPILDKPGKGAFYETDLHLILEANGIRSLILCGVTTEVCVNTTAREANDRGYEVLVVEDAVASYFPEFHRVALEMIRAQGAIVGWVAQSAAVSSALAG